VVGTVALLSDLFLINKDIMKNLSMAVIIISKTAKVWSRNTGYPDLSCRMLESTVKYCRTILDVMI